MKCLIVEDEQPAVKVLLQHISSFPELKVESICNNAMDAMTVLQKSKIDLMFLDIQLPKMNGFQLLNVLPQKPLIIVTTAFREFALEGYELEVTDYLLKPISFQRFAKAIGKAYKVNQPEAPIINSQSLFSEPFIYVKVDREFQRIALNALMIVESVKNHVKLITHDKTYLTLMSISELELKLPPNFLRIHRSYIVSKLHIEKFTASYVMIAKQTIAIGSHYKLAFQKWIQTN
ncbi:MAG: response regulator transcription factor [Cyclobacteriaceae bacterium]|nr:response regulator transcription factor [Cyclobacteriaceae bacterium]